MVGRERRGEGREGEGKRRGEVVIWLGGRGGVRVVREGRRGEGGEEGKEG